MDRQRLSIVCWSIYFCEVHVHDDNGKTALMWSSYNGYTMVVNALLAHIRKDVNAPKDGRTAFGKDGGTALMLAASRGHTAIVILLTHPEISVNVQNNEDQTALMLSARNGHIKVVNALLENCTFHINAQDKSGSTALMIAATAGYTKIVKALLSSSNSELLREQLSTKDNSERRF